MCGCTGFTTTNNRPQHWRMAGATYDSTIGYNETVGYRAGTTQVYKPLEMTRLLELPLHVMDTAMFYPAYRALAGRRRQFLAAWRTTSPSSVAA